jgi:hypothetical protein
VIDFSAHATLLELASVPPAGLPPLLTSSTCMRSVALAIGGLTVFRSNSRNDWFTGEPSTTSCVFVPSFVVGADWSTVASAVGVSVLVAAAASSGPSAT